jgi:hypothetical protein
LSVLGGATRPPGVSRKALLGAAVCALLVAGVGCGGGQGVAKDATVTAYVDAPLCAGAKRELAGEGRQAGSVRVRVVCLAPANDGSRQSLAAVGANARRATEDSTTVAYIEAPAAPSFSRPIVEAAGIPVIRSASGATAMDRLLSAIGDADSGSLRDSVREALA